MSPAYAGKSQGELDDVCADWDHPRLRGEKKIIQHLVSHD